MNRAVMIWLLVIVVPLMVLFFVRRKGRKPR